VKVILGRGWFRLRLPGTPSISENFQRPKPKLTSSLRPPHRPSLSQSTTLVSPSPHLPSPFQFFFSSFHTDIFSPFFFANRPKDVAFIKIINISNPCALSSRFPFDSETRTRTPLSIFPLALCGDPRTESSWSPINIFTLNSYVLV